MRRGIAVTGLVLGIVGCVVSACAVVFGSIGLGRSHIEL